VKRNLIFCIFLFSIISSDNAFSEEITVTAEHLKGIITESPFKTAKTTFDISIYKDNEPRGEFQGVSALKAPDRFTFKLFGLFGLTIFDVIGKDNTLQLYVPSNDELYQGDLPRDTWLIFGILEDRYRYVMEDINDYYILYLLDNEDNSLSIRAKFYFDKTELKQRKIDILKNGKTQFRAEINEFRDNFPLHMTFYFPSGITIVIKNKEIKLNEIPSEELFLLKDVEGREVKDIKKIL
jgi:outer membrane lipoprotein-sorting protein